MRAHSRSRTIGDRDVLIAQAYSGDLDSEADLLVVVVLAMVTLGLVVLGSLLRDSLKYRKGAKRGKWPTTKVRQAQEGGWHWTCWYCNEVSTLFPTREAAEDSASQHTDHVERADATKVLSRPTNAASRPD